MEDSLIMSLLDRIAFENDNLAIQEWQTSSMVVYVLGLEVDEGCPSSSLDFCSGHPIMHFSL